MKRNFKYIYVILLIIFLIMALTPIIKANSTNRIELKVISNKEEKDFELYMLLPEDYIKYAISQAGLNIEYNGVETLRQNEIPLIDIDKSKIQDETYDEGGVEYVQILLEPDEDNTYTFDIIASYSALDMNFRVKNDEKDYIMHIDNFEIEDNVCEIEYDYDNDVIKQPTKIVINFGTLLLIIILIFIVSIGIISQLKTKNKKEN